MRSAYNGTLGAEIARLNDLGLAELRHVWKERLGTPPAELQIIISNHAEEEPLWRSN